MTSTPPPAMTYPSARLAAASVAPAAERRTGWSPARLAYGFYAVAATGAVIGQTWVALTHVPWPPAIPGVVRVAAVLPFAVCLELLAMALAAMADARMSLGERAYGFRTFSAAVAIVAVGILVAGHWPQLYWSASFGLLSGSAYLLWLLHSAARRRDALRATGKLADTSPNYGLWRRLRHPVWTARAAELARQGCSDPDLGWRPLGLFESLQAARLAIRADQRRPAIARAVEQVVRADQSDPRMADVTVRTLDLDRLAAELAERVDYQAWADRLAPAIIAPQQATGGRDTRTPPSVPLGIHTDHTSALAVSARPTGERVAGPLDTAPAPATPTVGIDEPAVSVSVGPGMVAATRQGAATAEDPPAPWTEYRDNGHRHQPGTAAGDTAAAAFGPDRTPPATATTTGDRGVPTDEHPSRDSDEPPASPNATPRSDGMPTDDAALADPPAPAPPPTGDEEEPGPQNPTAPETQTAESDGDGPAPGGTAEAVAYWYRQNPSLHPADIATRIGRSERTVRRHWPPALRNTVNGHDTSNPTNGLRAL